MRDSRGGALQEFLDYSGVNNELGSLITVWPQSRWGIFHLKVPDPILDVLDCGGNDGGIADGPQPQQFSGGYTPTDDDQHCPGSMSKSAAADLCARTGGELCDTQQIVDSLKGAKLGCNFDGVPVWSKDDDPSSSGGKKFVRCCANYEIPVDCTLYDLSAIDECASLTTTSECVTKKSGSAMRGLWGFGNRLTFMRTQCRDRVKDGKSCREMIVSDWTARDQCLWCPIPGMFISTPSFLVLLLTHSVPNKQTNKDNQIHPPPQEKARIPGERVTVGQATTTAFAPTRAPQAKICSRSA